MSTTAPKKPPLDRLLNYLKADPDNLHLLSDAAMAAFDAGNPAGAMTLIERHEKLAPLSATLLDLKARAALAQGKFKEAEQILGIIRNQSFDNPLARFHLAWAKAGQELYDDALALLDDDAVAASPTAPTLKIHVLHHLSRYDDALAVGQELAKRFPKDEALLGALATLALDMERPDLAQAFSQRAGRNAEGRMAQGFLTLGAHNAKDALKEFDTALALDPNSPRAAVGRGLALLALGDGTAAVAAIDRGAALFGTHLGSWIASGWAHFVNGETVKARESFERALAIDPNFAESHGGLAVMDIAAGDIESAKRRTDVALRLDKTCFGAALAKSLRLEQSGHARAAQRVREIAYSTPIGPNGRTIAQELVAFNIGARRPAATKSGANPKSRA